MSDYLSGARLPLAVALALLVCAVAVPSAHAADIYYSVGASADDLKTGSPRITISGTTATLTVAQTGPVGVGDVITYNGSTKAYIFSVISQTQFGVQTVTGGIPGAVSNVVVNSVKRFFNTLQVAATNSATASYLNTSNLTSPTAYNLTWVCYKDLPFTAGVTINGYTTGFSGRITLTVAGSSQVANGVSQRHTGIAGSGVIIDVGTTTPEDGHTTLKPRARSTGLVVRQLPDEVVVYDKDSHHAHCLNRTAAAVFLHADGRRTLAEIAALVGPGAGGDTVRAALDQLAVARLLESAPDEPGASRREVLRHVGAVILAPIVASLLVPTPAEAAVTCIPITTCTSANIGQPCWISNPAADCALRTCLGPGSCGP